jgi:hypothetical protein
MPPADSDLPAFFIVSIFTLEDVMEEKEEADGT